jgi:beta-galactosidase
MEKLFNGGWYFQLEGEENWREVEIPHDWLISDTKNLYASGLGKYKKIHDFGTLTFGQKVFLHFDGVYQDSTLYINGHPVGEWKHGYTAFSHDITPFLIPGENEILLTVHYQSPNSRWYSGAGIYRDCYLILKNAAHIIKDGVYITSVKENNHWRITVDTEVVTETPNYEVRHTIPGILYEDQAEGPSVSYGKRPGGIFASMLIYKPKLWDIDHPHCYTMISELYVNGQLQDTVETRFGFREIAFSPDGGFMLNGRRVQLNGVCQHHDLGGLGAAINVDALCRQLVILRDMGVNAIRTAHNPPAAVFMELADKMGFIIQSEFSDVWKRRKTTYDYARFFDDWAERDVAAWVRRDRNCPSLVMWSLGNEISDTHVNFEDGAKTMHQLIKWVTQHDPNRHAYPTLCSNYMPWENTQKCADIIKLIGYNYAEYLYHNHHSQYPDWVIYGGETASTVQSRGVYHFPLGKSILCDDDLQCSALGNSSTSWGAKNTEACIIDHRDAPFTLGQFLWTGFDYIGEPTPYHTKNSYFGQVDTAGFPKDSYYIYQSAWVDYKTKPMIHLFPYWDWNPGQPIDVRIASNAPKVELFLNGKSLGVQAIDHTNGEKLTADYVVPYEPGEIKAKAYDNEGNMIAESVRKSFGETATLKLQNSVYDQLIFTEITALDKNGNPVENANNRVNVYVKGGKLMALDNGDSTDYDQYVAPSTKNKSKSDGFHSRKLFNGKLLAITKYDGDNEPAITAEINTNDIPIRKIEITQNENYTFDAQILPHNATYSDLHWQLTDAGGIESPIGKIEPGSSSSIKMTPKGDGEIFVRCSVTNGKNNPDFISILPVTLSGFGKPFLDPYTFLSGGLHNRSNELMGNGNERGVATLRDRESHVGFADLTFGPHGSDEITLWIFAMEGTPFDFDIWLGIPGEPTARKLYTARYDKGSVWNQYIPATYKLPERLTGIVTLSFVFNRKVHIKGFSFTPPAHAFDQTPFTNHDHIYGDSYTLKENTIEKIGNNVSITFNDMDFTTQEPPHKIEIAWRANRENTLRFVFTPDTNTPTNGADIINQLILPAQTDYAPGCFPLDLPLVGKGKLTFIFLPGTEIDLAWFRFV